jgi:hypothetical protein
MASQADIVAYRRDYQDTYAPKVTRYLDAASRCPQGNRDATTGVPTFLPWTLGVFSKFSFGFVLPIGSGEVGTSAFIHGYGKADPDLFPTEQNPTVEFFNAWVKR